MGAHGWYSVGAYGWCSVGAYAWYIIGRILTLLNPEGQVEWNGQVYGSPSGAAKAAKGVVAVNGWKFWRYQHPETGKWEFIKALQG